MSPTPPQIDTDRLIRLLGEQCELYRQLRALSQRQRGLIDGDRPELLLNILQDRQRLVTELAKVNEALSVYRKNWDEIYARLPQPVRDRAAEMLDEINALLAQILKSDEEDSRMLSARRQHVAQSLAALTGGRAANAAYARQATRGTRRN